MPHGTWQEIVIYFPWKFSEFVVPAFIFSAAVKMAFHFEDYTGLQGYCAYVKNRMKRIFIPYVLWNGIYYICFPFIYHTQLSIKDFARHLLFGDLFSHFYFVGIIMQFYLLLPLWRSLTKKVPVYVAVPCAVLISNLSTLCFGPAIRLIWPGFVYSDRIFTTYLLFWVLGLYAGMLYEKWKAEIEAERAGAVLAALMLIGFALFSYYQYSHSIYFIDPQFIKPFTDCLSIYVLLHISIWIQCKVVLLQSPLRFVYRASYSVYLSHCLFLIMIASILQKYGVVRLSMILLARFAVCFTFPFILYVICVSFVAKCKTWKKSLQ